MSAFGGNDIEIAREHDRLARIDRVSLCVLNETLEPRELVVEFGPGLWIPVRQID